MTSLLATLCAPFKRLRKDKRGSIVVTFALSLLPLVGFVGLAVDYSRAAAARTALQAAADATALMLSKTAASLTNAQLQTQATSYFNALYIRPEATNTTVAAAYTTTGGAQVKVDATSRIMTYFIKVVGRTSVDITATSTTKWGMGKLRVALALDVTLSMLSDGKMTALKTATHNLLNQLQAAASTNGDIYVSMIPFNKDVNVGASNYTKTWVDFGDHGSWDGWDSLHGDCSKDSWWNTYDTKDECRNASGTWTADNHNGWNGCITDRDQDYDTNNTSPTTSIKATLFPAEEYGSCPVSLVPQTYNWTTLHDKVDDLTPTGYTNQSIGLAWAWMSLTDGVPLSPPAITDTANTSKVIILMSDGLNTQNRFGTTTSSIDARQAILCSNIKTANITIYTLHVNTDGDPTSQVLKDCASGVDKFYLLTSGNALISAFNAIGTTLSQLRIAK